MNKVAKTLVIIGALNWGLFGITDKVDLVQVLVGSWSPFVARVVYVLIGLAAAWIVVKKIQQRKSNI